MIKQHYSICLSNSSNHPLYVAYSTTHQRSVEVQFGRYQKMFSRSDLWSKSSHVLVVAAWNVFPIHSLVWDIVLTAHFLAIMTHLEIIPMLDLMPLLDNLFFSKVAGFEVYMFLLGGNIMPGTEKLWGELLFPEEKNCCFIDRRVEKQFFQRETNVLLRVFWPRHNVFSLKDTFSSYFILHKPLYFDGFCLIVPLPILHNLLADRPATQGAAGVPASRGPKGAEPLWSQCDDF